MPKRVEKSLHFREIFAYIGEILSFEVLLILLYFEVFSFSYFL